VVFLALAGVLAVCPTSAPAPAPRRGSRDLSSVNVCELMPGEVVAKIAAGRLKGPGKRTPGSASQQGCSYELGAAGEGTYEYVHVYLTNPDLFEPLESVLETEKGLGQKATGEILKGLGDEAFAVHNQSTKDTTVHVLRRGDVWLEVKANTLDHARKLAEAMLQRLGG
jgi:hypothetical protein